MRNQKDRTMDTKPNDGANSKSSKERSGNPAFGVDKTKGIMHKATNAHIRTELINIKFYFDAASESVERIIKEMDRLDKYEKER